MKYKVNVETKIVEEHEVNISLPLGTINDELLDQMVRKQARENPEGLVTLTPGERVVEVWREDVRIYPRAVKNGRKNVEENREEKTENKAEKTSWTPTPATPVFPATVEKSLQTEEGAE